MSNGMGGKRRPPPPSRSDAKVATREALVDAAAYLFGREGLDGPSLDAICERAGFTRGAFYVHFRDREELLVAVMDRVGQRFLDAVLDPAEGGDNLASVAQRFLGAVASGAYPLMGKTGIRPHQLIDACMRSRTIRGRYVALVNETIHRVALLIERGGQGGATRADVDAGSLATILLSAVVGAQTLIELGIPVDLPRLASAVLGLLAPTPSKPPEIRG
jgi:TetR/AcrR family transcriptional repressor of nem operon